MIGKIDYWRGSWKRPVLKRMGYRWGGTHQEEKIGIEIVIGMGTKHQERSEMERWTAMCCKGVVDTLGRS
jgi:hypothetical protein